MSRTVTYTLDPSHVPLLSDTELKHLDILSKNPDYYEDIPELDDAQLMKIAAKRIKHKQQTQVTLSLDTDILMALQSTGKDWQANLNGRLRENLGLI
jgi:uncharacterized protein (DUF4415 family)